MKKIEVFGLRTESALPAGSLTTSRLMRTYPGDQVGFQDEAIVVLAL